MEEEVRRVVRGRDKKGGMKVQGMEVELGLERHKLQANERKARNENKGRMRDGPGPACSSVIKVLLTRAQWRLRLQ